MPGLGTFANFRTPSKERSFSPTTENYTLIFVRPNRMLHFCLSIRSTLLLLPQWSLAMIGSVRNVTASCGLCGRPTAKCPAHMELPSCSACDQPLYLRG